jgi:hypothetical protein
MDLVSARIMKDGNVIAFGMELSETLPMPDKDAGVRYDPKPAVKWRRPRVRTDELTVQYTQFRFCWTVHEVEMRRHRNLE